MHELLATAELEKYQSSNWTMSKVSSRKPASPHQFTHCTPLPGKIPCLCKMLEQSSEDEQRISSCLN